MHAPAVTEASAAEETDEFLSDSNAFADLGSDNSSVINQASQLSPASHHLYLVPYVNSGLEAGLLDVLMLTHLGREGRNRTLR